MVVALGFGLAWYVLWIHYDNAKPRSPDAALGRIYSLNTHGSVVYLDRRGHYWIEGLQVLAGLFALSGVIIYVITDNSEGARGSGQP